MRVSKSETNMGIWEFLVFFYFVFKFDFKENLIFVVVVTVIFFIHF